MKYLSILLCCTLCFGFRHTSQDLSFLYQSWSLMQLKYDKGGYISTYKSSKEIGNYYGFTFRKDGTLAVSRGVSVYPESIQQTYEVVEGKWKISEDSIIEVSYSSNGYSYHHAYFLKQLNAFELVLQKLE